VRGEKKEGETRNLLGDVQDPLGNKKNLGKRVGGLCSGEVGGTQATERHILRATATAQKRRKSKELR